MFLVFPPSAWPYSSPEGGGGTGRNRAANKGKFKLFGRPADWLIEGQSPNIVESKPTSSHVHPLLVLLLLLAVPVVVFWKPIFFYILDDWTALIQMAEYPLGRYLVTPDGEQWFPFFHLVYYGLVHLAGERYSLLVFINCLGTGVNAFLLYLFFRRHWEAGLALTLSVVYALAAVHHAIAWNAFYVGYLLSLGLFLGALLLTDHYMRAPSWGKLGGIGLCAVLSVLSHNYPLAGLLALPLYLLVVGEKVSRRAVWALVAVIGLVYLIFLTGYLEFAGLHAAASRNIKIFSGIPGLTYPLHLVCGAVIAPFLYLLWGFYHFPLPAYIAGITLLALSLAVIWRCGGRPEHHLALWALLANLLPFVLVSLTRYQRSVAQAFVSRYGIFTLIGALLLMGTAWRLLAPRIPHRWQANALAGVMLAAIVGGQLFSLPLWTAKYQEMSRLARKCYVNLNHGPQASQTITAEEYRKFCPDAYPTISPGQVQEIHRLLRGASGH
jgi:hypothetical protein